jgi:putative restriction endonuclease
MPDYLFGNIHGVKEGDTFKDRQALREAGVHLAPVAGIDGNGNVGASSIVLNGGYVDDLDLGDEIIYTGHGGNKGGRQVEDQSWNAYGNKALIVSELHGLPVRVTRGYKHISEYGPSAKEYQYGGLYYVESHFEEIGKDGFLVCRYRLVKEEPMKIKSKNKILKFSEGTKNPNRQETTTLRIIRDTRLSRQIKELYDYTCQVCQTQILAQGVKYAEGAHIKPLGKPHNGKDLSGNIICLCPNHHVMLDKGVFSIREDLALIGMDGELNIHKEHQLDFDCLEYHYKHIYRK